MRTELRTITNPGVDFTEQAINPTVQKLPPLSREVSSTVRQTKDSIIPSTKLPQLAAIDQKISMPQVASFPYPLTFQGSQPIFTQFPYQLGTFSLPLPRLMSSFQIGGQYGPIPSVWPENQMIQPTASDERFFSMPNKLPSLKANIPSVASTAPKLASSIPSAFTSPLMDSKREADDDLEEEKDESLRGLPMRDCSRKLINGNAYKRRNVYKSIVRHMFSYVRKNRDDILLILRNLGYSIPEIEHAFFKVNYYNDEERQRGGKKKSQNIVKNIVVKNTIYVPILRETLFAMMKRWEDGKYGKVSKRNLAVYKEVCRKYYDETVRLLGKGSEGKSHLL